MTAARNAIEHATTPPPPAPTPLHLGQATAIEQSRAVAEVHAAIVVAQQCPRDMGKAIAEMRRSCNQRGLAERAFFSYPRGKDAQGKPIIVAGPSIHLARELARCFGNLQYGIAELRRDDEGGYSEMQAFAWDVQTNTRSTQIFVVPHLRDTKGGPKPLTELRDIYESNANNGARRLRAAIFSILPPWFTEEAQDLCRAALTDVEPDELVKRADTAVDQFKRGGITLAQLEEKIGRKRPDWTAEDIADLGVLFRSLQRREISREEAFPPARVTAAEIVGDDPPEDNDTWPDAAQPAQPGRR